MRLLTNIAENDNISKATYENFSLSRASFLRVIQLMELQRILCAPVINWHLFATVFQCQFTSSIECEVEKLLQTFTIAVLSTVPICITVN